MNHMTVYLKNKVLTDNLRTATVYVALFNNDVEVNTTSYARQQGIFATPTDGQTSNNADILFPIAAESWEIFHTSAFLTRKQEAICCLNRKPNLQRISMYQVNTRYLKTI